MTDSVKSESEAYQIDPDDADPRDYMRAIENADDALHIYLKDDKEWWMVHNPGGAPPGRLNGPWLSWSTYPSAPWSLDYFTREIMNHHVQELYYIDYNGDEAHSVHEATVIPIEDAPAFVQEEVR